MPRFFTPSFCFHASMVFLMAFFWSDIWGAGVINLNTYTDISHNALVSVSGSDIRTTFFGVFEKVLSFVRIVLNGAALIALLYVGFLWVTSMGSEEQQSDGKNRILLVFMGLFLINIPDVIYRLFSGNDNYRTLGFQEKIKDVVISGTDNKGVITEGGEKGCNYLFCGYGLWGNATTMSIFRFLEMGMVAIAIMMFTWGGFIMLFQGGDEEVASKAKRRIGFGVVALLLVGFIESIYRAILFGGSANLTATGDRFIRIVLSVANFFLYIGGPLALVFLTIGAYYYITSAGDEEKTKRGKNILMYTIFAVLMLILSYTFLMEVLGLGIFS